MEHRDDRLTQMFSQQNDFMDLLKRERGFPDFPVDLASKEGQRHVKEMSQNCVGELFEFMQLLKNSKRHRATEIKDVNRSEMLEELVDVQHFLIEVVIACGFTPDEFFSAYLDKGNTNVKRITQENY